MHDLVDDAAGQRFDCHFLFRRHLTQTSAHTVNFRLPDRFEMVVERDNRWDNVECLQADLKLLDFPVDDGFGSFGFLLAICNVVGHRLLQVVDVIDENAVELIHFGVNVAGYSDVDEEHGPVLAPRQKLFAVLAFEDEVRRSR